VILASGSPQRRAILEQLGIAFRVVVPDVDELREGDARDLVVENALRKARAVDAAEAVLGADTEVALDGLIYGKARDERQAEAFLRALSGRTHEVLSGLAMREADGSERTGVAVTRVHFRPLEDSDIGWYLGTGEWRGRAGAYAIQGRGAALVEAIEGDPWNVVGLPVPALLRLAPELFRP
jgi:septum formation protein